MLFVGAHIIVQFSNFSYRYDIIVHALLALLLALIDLLANKVKGDLGLISPQSLHMQTLLSNILGSGQSNYPTHVGEQEEDDVIGNTNQNAPADQNDFRQSLEGLLPRTSFSDMTSSTLNHPLSNCDSLYYRRNPPVLSSRNSFTTNPTINVVLNKDNALTPLLGNDEASNFV